ncbi:hypothetical protein PVL29_017762 [Vitis rotundifolia]|uniref:Uncharacterized protein n=1 Tax=Vitis rotundifolia TaxID=103349 RepID=A0AA39DJG7_VITRO|nr:hypothetical protein PVL29_017762 [Vitis rotundifolia]
MATQGPLLFCALVLVLSFSHCHGVKPSAMFSRHSFPPGFTFGAASAAYQYEGAAHLRGKSIWDTFTAKYPEKISDRSTGDVANDFYHKYKEDIQLLKFLGMNAFRFSISWTRVLPRLKPFVTLFHWDLPQALEDEYGGFLSPKIVDDYRNYVDFCFKQFGDRVKHWITLNEPFSYTYYGYSTGTFAPGRCSNYSGTCASGNSATEPYKVAHHLLLSHAAGVKLYKEKYQKSQKGIIGVTLVTHWLQSKHATAAGVKASHRALDFMLGWFLHPITYGEYPMTMQSLVGHRLPKFSAAESEMLKGSLDFLGINYYTSNYATTYASPVNTLELSWAIDGRLNLTTEKDGVNIGQPTPLSWLYICPWGIRKLMLYIKEHYSNPTIYITENGLATKNNASVPVKEALNDTLRITYHRGHLYYLSKVINYVDYKNGLKRYPKHSAYWFKKFLQK